MSVPTALSPHPSPHETPHAYLRVIPDPSQRPKARQEWLAREIEPNILGPMPVQEFLDEFFPNSPNSTGIDQELKQEGIEYKKIDFDSIPHAPNSEEHMYRGLVSTKRWYTFYLSNPETFSVTP